jgi:TetR/AcrR family transcriptional regulator, regulator of cefoperazone and chloramphenicol sensitivity
MARGPSDLTAAARIRETALRRFAERGVAATSIRDVAKAAGVSPGLAQHHFRSKARLRRVVEDHVMRRAIEAFGAPPASASAVESNTEMSARISAFIRANPCVFAYVGRSILEGDAAGLELFERFLALARAQLDRLVAAGLLRRGIDRDWTALHVVLIGT